MLLVQRPNMYNKQQQVQRLMTISRGLALGIIVMCIKDAPLMKTKSGR